MLGSTLLLSTLLLVSPAHAQSNTQDDWQDNRQNVRQNNMRNAIRVTVDGNPVSFSGTQPMMSGGRVMVPVRGVFEHMQADVRWDRNTRTVYAERGQDRIVLPIGSYTATVNGRQVRLETPARINRGTTMVPLRFLSEAMSADVTWEGRSRTVMISSNGQPSQDDPMMMTLLQDTVIPFRMNQEISSRTARVNDKFTATLDPSDYAKYSGLPDGTILEGHVDVVRAKDDEAPGVLGLSFDRIRTRDGRTYSIDGTLIGLDEKSISNDSGRLTAKPGAKNDNLKYVGYGAGAGALVSIITKTNFISSTLIGSALGFLLGEIQKDSSKSRDVVLKEDMTFGVRLTERLSIRMPNPSVQN